MQRAYTLLLSRTECLNILNKSLNVKDESLIIVNYQLRKDESAVGFAGSYYELILKYRSAGSTTPLEQRFFVKTLPQTSNDMQIKEIFHKEQCLYETLLAEMQKYSKIKWSPDCYYTRSDLIVLEHIKLCGYYGIKATTLNEEQLQLLLRSVAALHAASLIYEQRQGINIGCDYAHCLQEYIVGSNLAWFTTGLSAIKAVLRNLPEYQTARHLKFIDTKLTGITERVYKQISASTKYRNVLCHHDLWASNIFFSKIPEDAVILIDYQACRYAPPAIDLCFALYINLTPIERCYLENKCIDIYYKWLKKDLQEFRLHAEDILPKSELLESYEQFRLFGVIYSAVAATTIKVPSHFVTDEFKFVDRSRVILAYMQKNAVFKKAMEENCMEVMKIALAANFSTE